jgi:hypothetical protein
MRPFRNKEERAARQAEMEQRDQEHAQRFAVATARARNGPTRCQRCHAWLPSTATGCDYCEGVNLVGRDPASPRFTEADMAAAAGSDAESKAVCGNAVASFLRGIPGG